MPMVPADFENNHRVGLKVFKALGVLSCMAFFALQAAAQEAESECIGANHLVVNHGAHLEEARPCTFTDAYYLFGLTDSAANDGLHFPEATTQDSGVTFYPLVRRYLHAQRRDFFFAKSEYLSLLAAALANIHSGQEPVSRERISIYSTFILAEFRDQQRDEAFELTQLSREELTFAMSLQAVALEEIRTLQGIRCFVLADHPSVEYTEILDSHVYQECMN